MAVVEWADRLDGWLPQERLEIVIALEPADARSRTLRWRAYGDGATALAADGAWAAR